MKYNESTSNSCERMKTVDPLTERIPPNIYLGDAPPESSFVSAWSRSSLDTTSDLPSDRATSGRTPSLFADSDERKSDERRTPNDGKAVTRRQTDPGHTPATPAGPRPFVLSEIPSGIDSLPRTKPPCGGVAASEPCPPTGSSRTAPPGAALDSPTTATLQPSSRQLANEAV